MTGVAILGDSPVLIFPLNERKIKISCRISSPASSFAKVWVDNRSINHKEKKIASKNFENSTVDKKILTINQQLVNFQHELIKIIDKLYGS